MSEKVRMNLSIESDTKEKIEKFKKAGIDINISKTISSLLKFDGNSVETFISLMNEIHNKDKSLTRINVSNGMLILNAVEDYKKMDFFKLSQLDNPEIIKLINAQESDELKYISNDDKIRNLEILAMHLYKKMGFMQKHIEKEKLNSELIKNSNIKLDDL